MANIELEQNKREKLDMIQDDFKIVLSDDEYYSIMEAKTNSQLDRAAREIFNNHL